MLAAQQAPDEPDADHRADDIARPDVLSQKVVLGEICNEEGQNQCPVADSNGRIPNPYGVAGGPHFACNPVVRHKSREILAANPTGTIRQAPNT